MPNRMEEMASKTMGKAKATKARLKGLHGIFRTLSEEHGEADVLLKRIAKSSDSKLRAELFPKVSKELLAHERGELDVLYPRLRSAGQMESIVRDHNREATKMEGLIQELSALPYDDESWKPRFERLVELVEHHAKEEEKNYFPQAQRALGKDAAEELQQSYLAKKQEVMQQLG